MKNIFKTKNLSPSQLAFLTTAILATLVGLVFYAYSQEFIASVVAFLLFFILGYFLIKQVLDRFIYRKIKLIYKFINQTKASKREEMYYKYILPEKSIDEVKDDVVKWARQRTAEIENLRTNETYRREFLQNFAHEIKTPVFAMQGYTELLLDDGALEDKEQCIQFLQKINRNIERLVSLANDVDEISKLESGQIKIHKEKFIIQELIEESFESVQMQAEPKNIHCSIKSGCESPLLSVYADKDKIRQVIINIIVNAIKYSPDGSNVVAGVYTTDENHVLVEISDNGHGIAEEHLLRVFERFYRTDSSRNRKIGGSGLGLSICKHIIEAHGENIHIRSKLGVGTTLGFTLSKAPVSNSANTLSIGLL